MSAIPNLNTLRRGRGGPRLRGRRDGADSTDQASDDGATQDRLIQQTDNDASSSRLSAVELGYMNDSYAKALATPGVPSVRRYPLINRGTYVRTVALDRLVLCFLQSTAGKKQIVSLGAGSDTRYFRLLDGATNVIYHELDFEVNINAKKAAIDRSDLLSSTRHKYETTGCTHHLHAVDLRDLRPGSEIVLDGFCKDVPTLILSECCLCYLPHEQASATLAYFTEQLTSSYALILYEPVRPNDAFGKTMIVNLSSRGIHMQTLRRYASLEAQRHRLKLAGFTDLQSARDVFQIWSSDDWISKDERERVEHLEWLDEIEEWNLLAAHYCIAWACKGDDIKGVWQDIAGTATQAELDKDM